MVYTERLQEASFRGVPFKWEDVSLDFGPQWQIDEYPEGGLPSAEYTGDKTDTFSINCYVIGPDHDIAGRRLEAALRRGERGVLVHPNKGQFNVVVESASAKLGALEGGIEYFAVTFKKVGPQRNPTTQINAQSFAQASTQALQQSLTNQFAQQFTLAGMPDFVQEAASNQALSIATALTTAGQGNDVALVVANFRAKATGWLQTPRTFAEQAITTVRQVAQAARSLQDRYRRLRGLLSFGADFLRYPLLTRSRRQQFANEQQLIRLVRLTALGEMGTTSTEMTWGSYDAAAAHRQDITGHFNTEILRLSDAYEDELAGRLRDLKTVVVGDVTERGANLVRVKTVTINHPLPALVVAYDLYEDPAREDEILARNNLLNPLVVQGNLQVLSS